MDIPVTCPEERVRILCKLSDGRHLQYKPNNLLKSINGLLNCNVLNRVVFC